MSCRRPALTFLCFPARFSHHLQNEYETALGLVDRALSIFKEAYGETHASIALVLGARARIFMDLVSAFMQELCWNIALPLAYFFD